MTIIDNDASTLQSIIDSVAEAAPAQTKSGKARKAELAKAIKDSNIDEFMALQENLSTITSKIVGNKIDLDNLGELSAEELEDLMIEHLKAADALRFLEVRYAMRREAIFAHITARNEAKGVSDPEHTPGEAPVPALGRKWTREGGRLKARLDHDKLAELLGDGWAEVCDEVSVPKQVIKAHTDQVLNEQKLVEYIQTHPAAMTHVKDAVIPGGYGASKLMVREIKKSD